MSTTGGARPDLRRVSIDGYPMPGFYPLRPLRIGEIFGAGFRITGRNLRTLVPVSMLIGLVAVSIQLGMLAAFGELHHAATQDYIPKSGTMTDAQLSEALGHLVRIYLALYASTFISFFGQVVVSAVAVTLVTDGATSEQTEKPWRRLKGRYGAALLAALLAFLATFVGTVLLIIPGIIVGLMLYVAVPASVVEGTPARASLQRSRQLTRGYKGRIFGILTLTTLIFFAVVVILGLIVGQFVTGGSATSVYVWVELVSGLLGGFVSAWGAVVTGLIYVDLRMRAEGLGRVLWEHAVRQAPPAL